MKLIFSLTSGENDLFYTNTFALDFSIQAEAQRMLHMCLKPTKFIRDGACNPPHMKQRLMVLTVDLIGRPGYGFAEPNQESEERVFWVFNGDIFQAQ